MADKKLNDVSAVTDAAYVYAEDSSGNQVKIKKADLASVVGELLSVRKGFRYSVGQKKSLVRIAKINIVYTPILVTFTLNTSGYAMFVVSKGSVKKLISNGYLNAYGFYSDGTYIYFYQEGGSDGYTTYVHTLNNSYIQLTDTQVMDSTDVSEMTNITVS